MQIFLCLLNSPIFFFRRSIWEAPEFGLLQNPQIMSLTTSTFLHSFSNPKSPFSSSSLPRFRCSSQAPIGIQIRRILGSGLGLDSKTMVILLGTGFTVALLGPESASAAMELQSSLQFNEPQNALSLPTWVIHVSSVVEW